MLALLLVSSALGEFNEFLSGVNDLTSSVGISEEPLITLLRLAVLILVVFILFEIISHVGLSQGTALAISITLGILSVLLIPEAVLVGIGTAYATLFALILLLIPIGGLLLIVFLIPTHSLFWRVVRVLVVLMALILEGMVLAWLS